MTLVIYKVYKKTQQKPSAQELSLAPTVLMIYWIPLLESYFGAENFCRDAILPWINQRLREKFL